MLSYITSLLLGVFIFLLIPVSAHAQATSGPVNPYSLWAKSGPMAGQVTLYWTDDGTASQYDVSYGTSAGQDMWGALNIGAVQDAVNSYAVGALTPGTTYYFSLVAKNGDQFVARTGPVWAKAAGGQVAAATTAKLAPVAHAVAPVVQSTPTVGAGPVSDYSFQASAGRSAGTVDLMWTDKDTASQYDLVYGTEPGKYMFGVQNIQEISSMPMKFTVGALERGKRYYFALVAENNGKTVLTTDSISAVAR